MLCLLGSPVPVAATLQENTSQTVYNPFPLEKVDAEKQLSTITISIGGVIGVVFATFVTIAVCAKKLLNHNKLRRLKKLDLFFSAAHKVADGQYFRVFSTFLGGIFSINTLCIIALVAVLLVLQNTTVVCWLQMLHFSFFQCAALIFCFSLFSTAPDIGCAAHANHHHYNCTSTSRSQGRFWSAGDRVRIRFQCGVRRHDAVAERQRRLGGCHQSCTTDVLKRQELVHIDVELLVVQHWLAHSQPVV